LPGQAISGDTSGFVLPLVVIIGLILLGGLATLSRSFGGLVGAIRQEQAGHAREIAETGLARTVGRLNRRIRSGVGTGHRDLQPC